MAAAFSCHNHPDRPAIGLCVSCRAQVCADCTTKVQGVNHCLACLAKRAKPRDTAVRRPSEALVPAGIVAALVFFSLVFAAMGAAFLAS